MMSFSTPCVRPMTDDDLERVLAWRNHPEVRRFMYTQHEISLEEHIFWFEKASKDPARHLLVFEANATDLGFISIHCLSKGGIADWGFYLSPEAPKGTGRLLGQSTMHYAFSEIRLHKICGQVLAHNERSIQFHQKLGFRQEGLLRDQHFDGQKYYDVLCFGLLVHEWNSHS